MERWQGKVAVITGAGSGIGAATAKALVVKGLVVVALDIELKRLQTEVIPSIPAEYQSNFHCHLCNVASEASVKEAFAWIVDKFGGVDILVNNAGIMRPVSILAEDNSESITNTVNINLLGAVWCTKEAFRSMKQRNFDGHIVNICSVMGHGVPNIADITFNIYPATKHGIKAFTEVLRQEFVTLNRKIKVTNISPGGVRTNIMGPVYADIAAVSSEDVADAIVYCIQTPPNVQIYEMIIKPVGETF